METGHDFDAIWREAGPTIWRAVYAYAGGRRDIADDAVAEAFARAIVRGEAVREPVPYVYRIAFRLATQDLKRMREQTEMPEAMVDPPDAGPLDVLAALRRLTPPQRAAVYLHYRADLPVREVARIMGTSVAAVKMQLVRGRRRLADLLENEGSEVRHGEP